MVELAQTKAMIIGMEIEKITIKMDKMIQEI